MTGQMIAVNPATGKTIGRYDHYSTDQAAAMMATAGAAFHKWRRIGIARRCELMAEMARLLEIRRDEYAALMTAEVGKPITESRAEIDKCAWVCRHYAASAQEMLADRHIEAGRSRSFVHHEPLGAVLAVMPWNFPFWQVFRFAAPALCAGNVGLLKHASNVPGCALAIEQAFVDAGFPRGVFQTLLIPGERVAEVVDHPAVVAATLTGSEAAGAALAERAGARLKKVVLELGGSDPYLVLEDADIELAAAACAKSRVINSGQSCIAAKRFIVHTAVYERWLERFADHVTALRIGNPTHEDTQVGPLARVDLREELHAQVVASVEEGARIMLGGVIPEGPGSFYPPTILVDVKAGMPAYDEELFGPVAAVIRVENEEEAIGVANDTRFGLGAAVFTRDVARGERIAAEQIDSGTCVVNALVASDPRLPFGGIKASGFGRELAELGIRAFVNEKTVIVD